MSAGNSSPIQVLLIEDDPGDAQLLRELLAGEKNPSFHVRHVGSLKEGLAHLAVGRVDVVLLDISLPDSTGLPTASRLHQQFPLVPIVVLTGLDDDTVALELVRNGAQDYLVKGHVDGNILSRVMRYAIERKRSEESLRKAYAQLQATQTELVQAEKLAALGRFSSGIAHEVKNPLGVVLGGVEFLERRLSGADSETKVALEKVKESILRADMILQGLLQFARPSQPMVQPVEVKELIEDSLQLLKYKGPLRDIQVEVEAVSAQMVFHAEKNQIQQVLFNLLVNAVEAMPQGGKLTVRTEASAKEICGVEPPLCVIEVADTGNGIAPEDIQRLFEPFFTTKHDQKGIGLGLATSKMIVENHAGKLVIQSQQGKGTRARVILPVRGGNHGSH